MDIKKWRDKLMALSAQIPAEDHERMAAALGGKPSTLDWEKPPKQS